MHVLICTIAGQQYAFDLSTIHRTFWAVEITPLVHTSDHILGVVNIRGEVVPVVNMRKLLGLPQRELDIKDHFVLCTVHEKKMILWVDCVNRVKECMQDETVPAGQFSGEEDKRGAILKEEDRLIYLCELTAIL